MYQNNNYSDMYQNHSRIIFLNHVEVWVV